MKHSEMMRPIVLKGTEEIEAAEDARNRSLKSGRAVRVLKEASARPPIVRRKIKA